MRMQPLLSAILTGLALATSGCATQTTNAALGSSVGLTMAQQIMHPQAGVERRAISGIDGQAAKSAYDAYQKTYRAPQPQPNVFTIGVGGAR
jgi:hypothetical protein